MDLNNIANLLIQIPLVAAFIWYALEMQSRHAKAQSDIAQRFSESMERKDIAYLRAINNLSESFQSHHEEMSKAIAVMNDRFKRDDGDNK